MIGKGKKDYIMIRTAISGLRLIAPASLVYLAASLFRRKFLLSAWLGSYALVEAAFYLFVYLPRNHLMQKVSLISHYSASSNPDVASTGGGPPSTFEL